MKESNWTGNPARALLASNEEDRFTTYLTELLQAPRVLRAFLNGPAEINLEIADIQRLQVDTQVVVPGGRADLVVSGPDIMVIFEAKVGAWLHGDQLQTYEVFLTDWLADHPDGIGELFLIAPESQLRPLIEAADEAEDVSWKGVSWEEIGRLFRELANDAESVRLRTHLKDFDDLVAYRLGDMARSFTAEETALLGDRLIGMALWRLHAVIEATIRELQSILDTKIRVTQGSGSFFSGYWLYYGERKYWFGFWIPAYARLGFSPLVIQAWSPLPFGFELPDGLSKPLTHQNLQGDIIPLPIEPNLTPDELGRVYADQIAALLENVAIVEG